jgi:hypothetical protein
MTALRSGSTPRKNDSSARVLTVSAAAELLRWSVKIGSTASCSARLCRISAAAERNAPEPFFHCRRSRREQSLGLSHTVVAKRRVIGRV